MISFGVILALAQMAKNTWEGLKISHGHLP